MRKLYYIFIGSLFSVTSCIDEVNLSTETEDTKLVIDAWISNDPEMSYVKVYESTPFVSGDFHLPLEDVPISGAWVENQDGFATNFSPPITPEQGVTVYRPSEKYNIEVGDQFRLNVILANGDHIQSDWQQVYPAANNIEFDYDLAFRNVFIERWNGPPFAQRRGFYDFNARVEKASSQVDHNYYVKPMGIEQIYTVGSAEFCSCTCYLTYPNLNYSLTAINSSSPASTYTIPMGSIQAGRNTRFFLRLDIYSVSDKAAGYLQSIGVQQTNTGSIFDPMPFKISGNLKNLNNPEKEVLGYFFTALHSYHEEMLNRAQIFRENDNENIRLIYPELVTESCQEEFPEADLVPPPQFVIQ